MLTQSTPNLDPTAQDADRLNWDELVTELVEADRAQAGAQWLKGDIALTIETTYGGGELARAAEQADVDYQQLVNYRAVAAAYENKSRDVNLTFTHHRLIMTRPDRLAWLELAAVGKWSVRQMLAEIESAEEAERAAVEHKKLLAKLAEQSADLVEAVSSESMTLPDALAEMAVRHAKAEQDRIDHEGRVRRAKGRIEQFLTGWIEFQDFRANPDRDEVLASLIPKDRERIIAIEKQMWG